MISITRNTRGNVIINDGAEYHSFAPDFNVFPDYRDENYIIITRDSSPNGAKGYNFDWTKVADPVATSRQDLFRV